jgi:RNA polymerase sigma-70 factor (ECF subfamily)
MVAFRFGQALERHRLAKFQFESKRFCVQTAARSGFVLRQAGPRLQSTHVDIAENQIVPFPGSEPASGATSDPEVAEDLRLLRRIAAGDQQAVALLYQQRGTLLYSLLLRMLGDPMEAQEVMQDTFVRIWRRAGSYEPARSAPLAWMILIARGLAVDRLRTRSRRQAHFATLEAELASIEIESINGARQLERDELSGVCAAALHRLPEAQAQALQLAFLRGWTHEEIAHAQKEPLGTIKARIRRGLQALRQVLKDYRDA